MKPKTGKVVKIILVILFLLILGLKFFGEPFLQKKITQWQPKKKHPYYVFNIGEVDVRILRGSIYIKNLSLTLNPGYIPSADSTKTPHLYEIKTDLKIKLFNAFKLVLYNQLKINEVYFNNTEITWYPNFYKEKSKTKNMVQDKKKKKLKSLQLGEIIVDNARLIIKDKVRGREVVSVDSVAINIRDFFIQSSEKDSTVLPQFKEISISTGSFNFEYTQNSFTYGSFWLNTFHDKQLDQHLIDIKIHDLTSNLSNNQGSIVAQNLFIKDLNFDEFFIGNKIIIDSINIGKADLQFVSQSKNMDDSEVLIDTIKEKNVVDSIRIRSMVLVENSIRVVDKKQVEKARMDSLSLSFDNLIFKTESLEDFTFHRFQISSGPMYFNLGKEYDLSIQSVNYFTDTYLLKVNEFELIPTYSKEAYSKVIKYEKDLFDINIDSILIQFEPAERVLKNEILINNIDVYQLDLDVYRDKWVQDPAYIVKEIPNDLIKKIKKEFEIKEINLHSANIVYSQLGDIVENETPGKFELEEVEGSISNITNMQSRLKNNSVILAEINAKLMGSGKLTTSIGFDLNNPNQFFTAKGNMDHLPMLRLNPFLMGVLMVEIPEGVINNLTFDMEANREYIKGHMTMEYQDLQVMFHKSKKQGKASSFTSFLANTVVNKQNLKGDKDYKEAIIFSEVVKNKSIFNNIWQGIKSGIMDILVITSNQEKALEKYEKTHTELIQ